MKVARIEARCLSVPIKFPFTETPTNEGMLLVQVGTDDGLVGHGISREAERFAVRELINRDIGPFLIGRVPLDTENIWMDAPWEIGMSYMAANGVVCSSHRRGRPGPVGYQGQVFGSAHLPTFGRFFSRFGCRLHHLRIQRL